MDFVDATLIRLADAGSRAAVFDQQALEQLVAAGHDTGALNIGGPYQALFDDFRLGVSIPPASTIEGSWMTAGGTEKTEARFQLAGLGQGPPIRVDAMWRGSIVARIVPPSGQVSDVQVAWPSLGLIDEEIIADMGALPQNPAALEQARLNRLLPRIRAGLHQKDALTVERLMAWLDRIGVASVGELLSRHAGSTALGAVQVTFSPPADPLPQPTPQPLSIAAALLVRDAGFSVAQLLMESKLVRDQLAPLGLDRVAGRPKPRRTLLIVWVIPAAVFDDADWPGAAQGMNAAESRAARRALAGVWLAREGIGLVAVSPPA